MSDEKKTRKPTTFLGRLREEVAQGFDAITTGGENLVTKVKSKVTKPGQKQTQESIFRTVQGEPLALWAHQIERKGVTGLQNEFEEIPKAHPNSKMKTFFRNPTKNRYVDIPCLDDTRVKLGNGPTGDYIHANFVDGYSRGKQYICTQGPLQTTIEDFWRLVWQENCLVVVMLTRFVENDKVKCASYFAEEVGQEMTVGKFKIKTQVYTHELISGKETIFLRDLIVTFENCQREIRHIHYLDWPDRGIPSDAISAINLTRKIHQYHVVKATKNGISRLTSPILLHCAAGIGRTGTLVTLDICFQQVQRTGQLNVKEVARRLRQQRAYAVQTDEQYIFIHRAIIDWAIEQKRLDFDYKKFNRLTEFNFSTPP